MDASGMDELPDEDDHFAFKADAWYVPYFFKIPCVLISS
jgi:hypothetical protein